MSWVKNVREAYDYFGRNLLYTCADFRVHMEMNTKLQDLKIVSNIGI